MQDLAHCLPVRPGKRPGPGRFKLPPQIPVHAGSGRVTLDLRPLLAETNDVEITRVSVCRRVGSHCQETLWRIELPPGWRAGEIEVFGDYPGSSVLLRR